MISALRIAFGILLAFQSATLVAQGASKPVYVPELSCREGPFRIALPVTVAALRQLGPLKKEQLLNTLTWPDNTKSYVKELQFDGLRLRIEILSDPNGSRYALSGAKITSARWAVAPNYKVGDVYADVVQRLGLTNRVTMNQVNFTGDTETVSFVVKDNRILEIKLECYID